MITNKTKLFISVSAAPGNLGARVYNSLFAKHSIDAVYLPRKTPATGSELVSSIRSLNIDGCSVSMPLKSLVLAHLDRIDPTALSINSVNTIVSAGGILTGYNTDYLGVRDSIIGNSIKSALIVGSGGVVGAVIKGLQEAGVSELSITSRSTQSGMKAASNFKVNFLCNIEDIKKINRSFDLLVNATPAENLDSVLSLGDSVFDLVAKDGETPVIQSAKKCGKKVFSGFEMFKHQVRYQFKHYTGIFPEYAEITHALSNTSNS